MKEKSETARKEIREEAVYFNDWYYTHFREGGCSPKSSFGLGVQ